MSINTKNAAYLISYSNTETTCIKRPPVLRGHCSNTTILLNQLNRTCV